MPNDDERRLSNSLPLEIFAVIGEIKYCGRESSAISRGVLDRRSVIFYLN